MRRARRRKDPAEWQADRFAASLLMPAADVQAAIRILHGEELPSWPGLELRDLADEVIEQGRFFNVSNEAMRYRLLDLRLVVDSSQPQRSLFR